MGDHAARVLELFLQRTKKQDVRVVTCVTPQSLTPCITSLTSQSPAITLVTPVTYKAKSDDRLVPEIEVGVTPAPFAKALARLKYKCPPYIDPARWQQCLVDAQAFLDRWGEQALTLGWTTVDLFGLHEPPTQPHPSYNRLARYDATGLLWLLQGCAVVALTEATAVVRGATGGVMTYRRHHKPALGSLGDSLGDLG